ncbi:MAG: helix-turn-helix domain-containing protein [Bacteroidota bacterium]
MDMGGNLQSQAKKIAIETRLPSQPLQPYIDFYYFIKNDSTDFKSIHYSFPHLVNVVSIYQHAKFESAFGTARISSDPDNDFLSLLQGKCQHPLRVELIGKTNRISIWFKNLRLNHFIRTPLGTIMGNTTNQLCEWDSDPIYQACLQQCFATDNIEHKVALLEEFLIAKLLPISFSYLEKAANMLMDIDKDYSINDILKEIDIPTRTFNRHFKEALGVAPIEFQRIARFRHSVNNKLFDKEFKKLTAIGYDSHFYDQSDFIKMYKKLTGSNPKAFFNTVNRLANDKLILQFVKE